MIDKLTTCHTTCVSFRIVFFTITILRLVWFETADVNQKETIFCINQIKYVRIGNHQKYFLRKCTKNYWLFTYRVFWSLYIYIFEEKKRLNITWKSVFWNHWLLFSRKIFHSNYKENALSTRKTILLLDSHKNDLNVIHISR